MYGQMFIFVENFHVNNHQWCWKFFMCLIFMGQGYPQKLLNLEHFLIYSILYSLLYIHAYCVVAFKVLLL